MLVSNDIVEFVDVSNPSRLVTIGFSSIARVLFVVSTEVGVRVRIISARRATPAERRAFQER